MVKSAEELRKLAAAQREQLNAVLAQKQAQQTSVEEKRINDYYQKMLALIENLSDAELLRGWIMVYRVRGDYAREGSLNSVKDSRDQSPYPGLEEAWARLRAKLEPQGYHLVRRADTFTSNEYNETYRTETESIVEWDAPWIRNR